MKKTIFILGCLTASNTLILIGGGACSGGFTAASNKVAPAPTPQTKQPEQEERKKDAQAKSTAAAQPMHIRDIVKTLKNEDEKIQALERLMAYYGNGNLEKSEYFEQVKELCEAAKKHFASIKPTKKDAKPKLIVFDLDDTMLTRFYRYYFDYIQRNHNHRVNHRNARTVNGVCRKCNFNKHPFADDPLALAPVKNLWDTVTAWGFKTAIISNNRESARADLCAHLQSAGYKKLPSDTCILLTEDKLFQALTPHDGLKIATLKLAQRKKLAQTYEIVGNVGDFVTDFYGGSSGYEVRLPNYYTRLELPTELPPVQSNQPPMPVMTTDLTTPLLTVQPRAQQNATNNDSQQGNPANPKK